LEQAYRRLRTSIIEHGHELTAERSLAVVIEQAGYRVTEGDIAAGTHELMMAALEDASPVPGAVETVIALAEVGVPLGVVSSAVHHSFLEWALAKFGVLDRFETVVTSAGSGYYKSRPEIYWTALTKLGAEAATSVHVGDSARFDVDGATRAGMKTVWLRRSGAAEPSTTPNLTLDTLEDSAARVLRLLRNDAA
jgi:putative hydrolase of the HAD superfamily